MRACTLMAVAALAVGAALPGAACAQATPEGAAELESAVKAWLSETLRAEDLEAVFIFNGDVEVVPQGDRYRMTIPSMTAILGLAAELVIDPIEVELIPADRGRFEATWTIPDTYVLRLVDAREIASMTIGSQHGSGLFAPEYEGFLDVDLALNDIAILPANDEATVGLDRITVVAVSEEPQPGIFDSDFLVEFAGIEVVETATGDHVAIGEFALAGAFKDLNLSAYLAFFEELEEITQSAELVVVGRSADIVDRLRTLIETAPTLMDEMALTFRLSGLDVDVEGEQVILNELAVSAGFAGMATDVSHLSLDFFGDGLAIAPEPQDFQYFPTEVAIGAMLRGIPNDAIVDAMAQFLGNMMQMGPEAALMLADLSVQQAMAGHGSSVDIDRFTLAAPAYTVDLQGSVSATDISPFGAVGDATLIIGKLDQLQQDLMASPATAEPAQAITLIQAMGREDVDFEGNPARRFEIELTETGTVLLNGSDMVPILEQMR